MFGTRLIRDHLFSKQQYLLLDKNALKNGINIIKDAYI